MEQPPEVMKKAKYFVPPPGLEPQTFLIKQALSTQNRVHLLELPSLVMAFVSSSTLSLSVTVIRQRLSHAAVQTEMESRVREARESSRMTQSTLHSGLCFSHIIPHMAHVANTSKLQESESLTQMMPLVSYRHVLVVSSPTQSYQRKMMDHRFGFSEMKSLFCVILVGSWPNINAKMALGTNGK